MPAYSTAPRRPQQIPWHRGRSALEPGLEARELEPAQLYGLLVLAFHVHVPDVNSDVLLSVCCSCGESWPCPQVRLAFRLREGF